MSIKCSCHLGCRPSAKHFPNQQPTTLLRSQPLHRYVLFVHSSSAWWGLSQVSLPAVHEPNNSWTPEFLNQWASIKSKLLAIGHNLRKHWSKTMEQPGLQKPSQQQWQDYKLCGCHLSRLDGLIGCGSACYVSLPAGTSTAPRHSTPRSYTSQCLPTTTLSWCSLHNHWCMLSGTRTQPGINTDWIGAGQQFLDPVHVPLP